MATARDERSVRPLSDPLLKAIAEIGTSIYALATTAGVDVGTLGRFARGECGMKLATVDLLFAALGLKVVRGAEGCDDPLPPMPTGALLAAIEASKLSAPKLSGLSGVHAMAIRKFVGRVLGLELVSADRLAAALGIVVIQGPKPAAVAPVRDERRPIFDAILAEIEARGLDAASLARATGIRKEHLERLLGRRGDVKLAKADRLCEYLGIGFAVASCGPPAVPSEALRATIKASGISLRKLSKLSGVVNQSIEGFMVGVTGLELLSADRIAAVLGLAAYRGEVARPSEPPPPDDPSLPYVDGLRAATLATGLSVYAISRSSGLSQPPIARFLKGDRNLTTASIAKLACAVGFDPSDSGPPPVVASRCPVELKGDALPIILDGKTKLPDMTGDAYKMLNLLVEGFQQGRKIPFSELAALSESKRVRPLTDALDRPGFGPLRDRIRETKDGRNKYLEIVDVNLSL